MAAQPDVPQQEFNSSLESFIAFQVRSLSGGHQFAVSDLTTLSKHSNLLVVLDGFDEIANVEIRAQVVEEISKAAFRIESSAKSLQIVVTSRPSAFANSPGFPEKEWPHFELGALSPAQITLYADKWLKARGISAPEQYEFHKTLRHQLEQPHVRDLARNPMQLAILLSVINVRGFSLPEKRTALYDNYVQLFFNRESEKSAVVRDHRDLLIHLHQYLAWVLHTESEAPGGTGSFPRERMRSIILHYLSVQRQDTRLVDSLFTGMVERVVALVSRVQGTYEFEVQPLREYFAARYLYETLPYSPAGAEKRGTMPERFDALARNFYWLNVTRFYCGCYSRGQLASLVEGIEGLLSSPLGESSYPRKLAFMLLGDWVFAQQPISGTKILKLLLEEDSFKIFLSALSSRGGESASLPDRCGRGDLLAGCKRLFADSHHRDVKAAVADVIVANCSRDELWAYWQSLYDANLIRDWFSDGRRLGLFSGNAETDWLEKVIDDHGAPAVETCLRAGQLEVLGKSSDTLMMAIQVLLDSDISNYATLGAPDNDDEAIVIAAELALNPVPYLDFGGFGEESSLKDLRTAQYDSEKRPAGELSQSRLAELEASHGKTVRSFLEQANAAVDLSTETWQSTLHPWNTVVEAARQAFGEHRALYRLATISAGIRSQAERGINASLTDRAVPLCERARFARRRRTGAGWWIQQVKESEGPDELFFTLLLLCSWAAPGTLLDASSAIALTIDNMSDSDWTYLCESISQARRFADNKTYRLNFTGEQWGRLRALSPRLVYIFTIRCSAPEEFEVYLQGLQRYRGKDRQVLGYCCRLAFACALKGEMDWNLALEIFRRGYEQDVGQSPYNEWNPAFGKGVELDLEVAAQISDRPALYPVALLRIADAALTNNAGSTTAKVGEVATRDHWFEDLIAG